MSETNRDYCPLLLIRQTSFTVTVTDPIILLDGKGSARWKAKQKPPLQFQDNFAASSFSSMFCLHFSSLLSSSHFGLAPIFQRFPSLFFKIYINSRHRDQMHIMRIYQFVAARNFCSHLPCLSFQIYRADDRTQLEFVQASLLDFKFASLL